MVKPTFEFAVWFFFVPLVEWEDGDFFHLSNGKAYGPLWWQQEGDW